MALPEPKPGLVVRYDYLWSREAAAGRHQGKDRPACLAAASDSLTTPRYVVLLPITHAPPQGDTVGVEIPPRVRKAIGLDDAPSWVIVSEHNVDEWPNGGLSPLPGKPGMFAYGFLPPALFAAIKARFLVLTRDKKSDRVMRRTLDCRRDGTGDSPTVVFRRGATCYLRITVPVALGTQAGRAGLLAENTRSW